jgi:hypothetical protein
MVACETTKPQHAAIEAVVQLRKDNEQLRKFLADAQERAETAATRGKDMDFAHLLDLVKEFSTDLGGSVQQDGNTLESDAMVSMNTEHFRLDDDDEDERDLQLQKLKAKVAAAKSDLAKASAAALRAEPDSSDEESESDTDSEEDEHRDLKSKVLHRPAGGLDGYWTSCKTGHRHYISSRSDSRRPAGCTSWQAKESSTASLTLRGGDGQHHVLERLRTRMLGEALLWDCGEMWTRQR